MDPFERLTISGLAGGGRGVARAESGQVWLVKGAVPGDRVEAVAERRKRSWVAGRVTRLVEPSADRREPPCPLQSECGGCPWMVLPERLQAEWKERILLDALSRVARLDEPPVDPIRSAPEPLGWRNRVEFSLGTDASGRAVVGLHRADGGGLVDVSRCLLQGEPANAVLATARSLLSEAGFVARRPARLVIRAASSGQLLIALRESGQVFPDAKRFATALREKHPEIVGVVRVRTRPDRRGGARIERLAGTDVIEESLGGVSFPLPAATFIQTNPAASTQLVEQVLASAGDVDGRDAVDLYGGVGVYAFALAGRGARVTVCDADRDAIRCGRETARRAARRGLAFVHADTRRFLEREIATGNRPALAIANPPRTGFGPGVADSLALLGAGRLVVVSCDPATLARDLRRLIDAGYRLERVVPFDLFPQTAHVEAVATLTGPG